MSGDALGAVHSYANSGVGPDNSTTPADESKARRRRRGENDHCSCKIACCRLGRAETYRAAGGGINKNGKNIRWDCHREIQFCSLADSEEKGLVGLKPINKKLYNGAGSDIALHHQLGIKGERPSVFTHLGGDQRVPWNTSTDPCTPGLHFRPHRRRVSIYGHCAKEGMGYWWHSSISRGKTKARQHSQNGKQKYGFFHLSTSL